MTTDSKPSNYSAAQVAELESRAKSGPLNADIAAALAKTPLFAGKSARSIISKVKNLNLPYELKGAKTPVAGAKAKDETVMEIQDDIRKALGIPAGVSLNQKAGFLALRQGIERLMAQNAEIDEVETETVEA